MVSNLTFNMRVITPGGIGLVKERMIRQGQEIGILICHQVEIPRDLAPELRKRTAPCCFKVYLRSELEACDDM